VEVIADALAPLLPPRSGVSAHPTATWTGFECAREALARAGSREPLRPSAAGPVWPEGFAGSVSHSHRIAIAAATSACRSLGVDIEPIMSFLRAERVEDAIASPRERLACAGSPVRLTCLFSAKESLYKCLYPSVRAWFDFDAAEVVAWDDRARIVSMALTRNLGPFLRGAEFEARWANVTDHVLTVVALDQCPETESRPSLLDRAGE
jgi:enterobactin synthetase component D